VSIILLQCTPLARVREVHAAYDWILKEAGQPEGGSRPVRGELQPVLDALSYQDDSRDEGGACPEALDGGRSTDCLTIGLNDMANK
jgi:hypothetical protein